MQRSYGIGGVSAGISLALFAWTGSATADTAARTSPPTSSPMAQPGVGERFTHEEPNRAMLVGGLLVFGVSYVPSLFAAAGANTASENFLGIPLLGPWLDIGNRPACSGHLSPACSPEWGRTAVLVADGLFQAAGATAVVLAFALPGANPAMGTMKLASKQELRLGILPAHFGADGYGLTAVGDF
jgi:hypothetical protein